MENDDGQNVKTAVRIHSIVKHTEEHYKRYAVKRDTQNLAMYRGEFWRGDGAPSADRDTRRYTASQNEIFPIVDTLMSSLAQDVPGVELLDQRARRAETPSRGADPAEAGKSLAAVLNYWADKEEYDVVARELILHAALFRYGVAKTVWDAEKNRATTTTRLPWEVHFDPTAKKFGDVAWCYETFTLHIDDLKERLDEGLYDPIKKEIRADGFPRNLVDEESDDERVQQIRESGLNEWTPVVEFYDLRAGMMYHFHAPTQQILMQTPVPWGNPYTLLTFHDGVGRIEGIPDVSLLADNQRDINEQVSARREMVRRLPRRMLIDRSMFQDDMEWDRWRNSKTWEPTRVSLPPGLRMGDGIYVTPEMPTTFDFNSMLGQTTEALRRTAGTASFERGQVENIRTAAEAHMLQGGVDGRVKFRMRQVVRVVKRIFENSMGCWRWAIRNEKASGIDMEAITLATQVDIAPDKLAREALELALQFRPLPFSPVMEDKHTRRQHLSNLLPTLLGSPMLEHIDQRELVREVAELFGFRPSLLKQQSEVEAEAAAAAIAAQPGALGPGDGSETGGMGMDPSALAGLLGGSPEALG